MPRFTVPIPKYNGLDTALSRNDTLGEQGETLGHHGRPAADVPMAQVGLMAGHGDVANPLTYKPLPRHFGPSFESTKKRDR